MKALKTLLDLCNSYILDDPAQIKIEYIDSIVYVYTKESSWN